MSVQDEVRLANEHHWERMVREGCGYTVPWLDLDPALLRAYARGEVDPAELDPPPEPLMVMYPPGVLADVAGKDVLCLAAGGGQQSAAFGVLGARVTVVDLAQGQLDGDQAAAAHYGYQVTTLHADMRDLSGLDDGAFDLVYGTGLCYVPDLGQVYAGVARVLRPGGLLRLDFGQPAVHFVDWNGEAYCITRPYAQRIDRRADGAIEFRHYLDEIFNGLITRGFAIQEVAEEPAYLWQDPEATPGSWAHCQAYVGAGFAVVARKGTP